MVQLYLTRRNLLTLLSKLDRAEQGESTACTIVKNDTSHPKYPCSHNNIYVTAVEDEKYYTERRAGEVHPADCPEELDKMTTLQHFVAMYTGVAVGTLIIGVNLGFIGVLKEREDMVDMAVWICLTSLVWPVLLPALLIYLATGRD